MKKKAITCTATLLVSSMVFGATALALGTSETETVLETQTETEAEPETELVLEKPGIMYLLDTVRVHEDAATDSETIGFCDRGSSVSILGILGEWYHVRLDDPAQKAEETEEDGEVQTEDAKDESASETEETEAAKEGYIFGKLLSDNPEDAKAAVEANDAEIARQQAAAAAAAAQGGGGGRTVVSRSKIEDCDGGGGTIITTYSDGSTSTSRY